MKMTLANSLCDVPCIYKHVIQYGIVLMQHGIFSDINSFLFAY